MPALIYFDVPADNVERARDFYSKLFDWEFKFLPTMEHYIIKSKDDKGNKGIRAGLGKREHKSQTITNFIEVESIKVSVAKVKDLGGEILQERTTVPGFGYMAVCKDTEGNVFGLWKTDSYAK